MLLMNMPHCVLHVSLLPGYSVESLLVYANGKDLSVTETSHKKAFQGRTRGDQGLDDEVIVEGWEE